MLYLRFLTCSLSSTFLIFLQVLHTGVPGSRWNRSMEAMVITFRIAFALVLLLTATGATCSRSRFLIGSHKTSTPAKESLALDSVSLLMELTSSPTWLLTPKESSQLSGLSRLAASSLTLQLFKSEAITQISSKLALTSTISM